MSVVVSVLSFLFFVCSRCSLEISHGHNINVFLEHSAKTKRRNSKAIHAAAHIKHTNIKSNQLFLGGLIHYCPAAAAAAAATTDPRRIKILSTEKNASVLHLYFFRRCFIRSIAVSLLYTMFYHMFMSFFYSFVEFLLVFLPGLRQRPRFGDVFSGFYFFVFFR